MARHKHTWTVKEKNILPNAFEKMNAAGYALTSIDPAGVGKNNMFYNHVIVHYACECGEEKVVRV